MTDLRAATLPSHAVTDESHRATCLVARGIEAQVPQQHQDVHRGVPSTIPRRAAPLPVGPLEGEQPGARALGGDPRALRRDLLRRRTGQIPHHLPADRRVGIKQPPYDRSLWFRDLPFEWIDRHLLVLIPLVKTCCWLPKELRLDVAESIYAEARFNYATTLNRVELSRLNKRTWLFGS
jgi:hypothetical protein